MGENSFQFFLDRQVLDLGLAGGSKHSWVEYKNVPTRIAVITSRKLATLYELQTIYSLGDSYDLYEIALVDNRNEEIANHGDSD